MEKIDVVRQREINLMKWASYWRQNPHRFASEYLGIKLFFFQKILLYFLNKNSYFMLIAARGLSKSWMTAVYCIVRCVLYPGTKIVIASGTKGQAKLIITEKIVDLYHKHSAVRYEIGDYKQNIRAGAQDASVKFKNGSKITAIASSDNSRGQRGNILIVDEFRMVDKDVIDSVLSPILNVPRVPEFKTRYPKKYEDYEEENIEIYISSGWYKYHWSWVEFNSYLKKMISNSSNFVATLPYQTSILHGLLKNQRISDIKTSDTYDDTNFKMEYDAMFIGENDKSYFKLEPLNKARTLNKVFIPPTNEEFVENNKLQKPKKLLNMPRKPGEIRLVSLDVALQGKVTALCC